jgi:ACT domain-containing protein
MSVTDDEDVLARIRVRVPDRPGSLGRVASAIGTASGDIDAVDVLHSEAGQALDDVVVRVRDPGHLQRVLDALALVPGVTVEGVHSPEPPGGAHADLQLVAQVLARPARALQTLVDGAPAALGVDWAAIVQDPGEEPAAPVLSVSTGAPAGLAAVTGAFRLRPLTIELPGGDTHQAALVPLDGCPLGLLVARAGLAVHTSELWRLGQLAAVVGPCLAVTSPA